MTDESLQSGEPTAPDANVTPAIEAHDAEAPRAETQVAASSPAVTDTDEIASKAKGVGKRIDELTRNWREAERREAALMELLKRQQAPQAPPPPVATPKTLADFEYDESRYQAHLFAEAEKRAVEAARRELLQQAQQETQTKRTQTFANREKEFSRSVDDYEDVAHNPDLPITQAMAEAILESDDGPALAYHLGKNPEIAHQIAGLPPIAAARELGRLETRLAIERERAKAEAKAVSKAPQPPPKIEGTVNEVSKDPSQMTDAEFAKWRARQIAQRRN